MLSNAPPNRQASELRIIADREIELLEHQLRREALRTGMDAGVLIDYVSARLAIRMMERAVGLRATRSPAPQKT